MGLFPQSQALLVLLVLQEFHTIQALRALHQQSQGQLELQVPQELHQLSRVQLELQVPQEHHQLLQVQLEPSVLLELRQQ